MDNKNSLFFIRTFGCQMNVYDSNRLSELLIKEGWQKTESASKADLIFLNTCAVREKAVQRVLGYANHLKAIKDQKPDLIIALGGCVAQQEGENLFKLAPSLDLVVGPQYLPQVPSLVEKINHDGQKYCQIGFSKKATWSGDRLELKVMGELAPLSAFITVMQGCNNFCAYCVVPYVRGREISRTPKEIIKEAQNLLDKGSREITLLGQNVNSYGKNFASKYNFVNLLDDLSQLDNLWRLRFTTSHPKDLSLDLIKTFGRLNNLCKQIHLPVQSGSDKVLKEMGRIYNRKSYLELINELRIVSPEIVISGDVIVGFPGESEADFQQTMDLIEEVKYDNLFSFMYSDRPDTPASKRSDKILDDEKNRRLQILQQRQREITIDKNEALLGQEVEVLVEGALGKKPGQLRGRTDSQKIVNFQGSVSLSRKLVNLKIVKVGLNSLLGEL